MDRNRLLVLPGASTGSVTALDKVTGKVLWKCAASGESWSTYGSGVIGELHDVRQYIVSLNACEIGVDVADGRLLWARLKPSHRLHGTHTQFVRDQQVLLHLGYDRHIVLLDLVPSNGLFEPREVRPSPAVIDPFQDSAFVIEDHTYVLSNTASCYAWKTGSPVWQERMGTSRAAATYADRRAYVRDVQGRVMLLKVTPEGKTEHGAFTLPHVEPASGATSPVVAGGRLYLRDQGTLYVYGVRRRDPKAIAPETWHIILPPPAIADPPAVGGGQADCEGRVPDAAFVPTPDDIVQRMLELADVKKEDAIYDLGSGDGRIVIAAAKAYGCRAVGIEIDPELVKLSRERVEAAGVGHRVTIEQGDLFDRDLSDADVVTLYLHPPVLERLKPWLATLKPGRRIVSHAFRIPGVEPRQSISMHSTEDDTNHEIHLYVTPLEPLAD